MSQVYVAPAFTQDEVVTTRFAVAQFVAVIAVIIAFFASVLVWCYFVCRNSGGLRKCDVGWFRATAICKR